MRIPKGLIGAAAVIGIVSGVATTSGLADSSPGGLRVTWDRIEKPWGAGSRPIIRVEGTATDDALNVEYRWLGSRSQLLTHGAIPRDAKGKFEGVIDVPRFSDTPNPSLHLQIDRSSGDSWLFRAGREFDAPRLQGLVVSSRGPVVGNQQIYDGKWGRRITLNVYNTSGVGQALLLIGKGGSREVVQGRCRGEAPAFVCQYNLSPDKASLPAVAQLTDLAGNRTTASVQGGAKP